MKRVRSQAALCFAAVLAASVPAVAAAKPLHLGDSDSAQVADAVHRFHAALAAGDSAGALALLAPDAVILESGEQETRAEYAAHHLGADIAFAKSVRFEGGALQVSVVGDAGWVYSLSEAKGEFNGKPVNSSSAELIVVSRVPGPAGTIPRWEIRAIHWSSHRKSS